LHAVKVVAPADGGAPKGSQIEAALKATLVFPVRSVAGATATVAPPPSTLMTFAEQLVALATLVI
jgi:hypothetical protein